jgi:uncharacterized membrane protein YdbT with pleckstrin-like domain
MTAVASGACHHFDGTRQWTQGMGLEKSTHMAFADRLLSEGEQLVFELRTHGKALIRPAIVLIAACSVASFLAATIPAGPAQPSLRFIIATVALGAVLRWSVWPFLRWYTTTYVLTTRRLVIRQGVLSRHGHDLPLWRVTDVSFSRTLGQRVLGCGTLVVETAGGPGPLVVADLPLVEYVQRELYRLTDHDQTRRAAETATAPAVLDRDGT